MGRHRRCERRDARGRGVGVRRRSARCVDGEGGCRGKDGPLPHTDGPYLECKEHIGGFWIIETPGDDAAMAWPDKATLACRGAVEMRPFQ